MRLKKVSFELKMLNFNRNSLFLLTFLTISTAWATTVKSKTSESLVLKTNSKQSLTEDSDTSSGYGSYFYDEDDYFYDDITEGSGHEDDAFGTKSDAEIDEEEYDDHPGIKVSLENDHHQASTTEKSSNDFHFDDENNKSKEEDILYEYYAENYDDDDDDYVEEEEYIDEKDDKVEVKNVPEVTKTQEDEEDSSFQSFFKLSYLYYMLASAFVSFCLAMLAFFLCRKSLLERREKQQKMAPFIVSSDPRVTSATSGSHFAGLNKPGGHRFSPIVKSYQRVPTSTQEFLHSDFHPSSSLEPSEKPLLT